MIELGKRQTLTVIKKLDFGVYLKDTLDKGGSDDEQVLLPAKEVPSDIEIMDPMNVFVYKDSKDRLIATTREPLIHLGEVAALRVKDVTSIGAFLDWGLEKDLFLPFKEQMGRLAVGDEVFVSLYVDKSNRLSATMWISGQDKKTSIYEKNAKVLLEIIRKNKGHLDLNDKSSPEEIKSKTGMSKNEFKKAIGNLYKNHLIDIKGEGIRLI